MAKQSEDRFRARRARRNEAREGGRFADNESRAQRRRTGSIFGKWRASSVQRREDEESIGRPQSLARSSIFGRRPSNAPRKDPKRWVHVVERMKTAEQKNRRGSVVTSMDGSSIRSEDRESDSEKRPVLEEESQGRSGRKGSLFSFGHDREDEEAKSVGGGGRGSEAGSTKGRRWSRLFRRHRRDKEPADPADDDMEALDMPAGYNSEEDHFPGDDSRSAKSTTYAPGGPQTSESTSKARRLIDYSPHRRTSGVNDIVVSTAPRPPGLSPLSSPVSPLAQPTPTYSRAPLPPVHPPVPPPLSALSSHMPPLDQNIRSSPPSELSSPVGSRSSSIRSDRSRPNYPENRYYSLSRGSAPAPTPLSPLNPHVSPPWDTNTFQTASAANAGLTNVIDRSPERDEATSLYGSEDDESDRSHPRRKSFRSWLKSRAERNRKSGRTSRSGLSLFNRRRPRNDIVPDEDPTSMKDFLDLRGLDADAPVPPEDGHLAGASTLTETEEVRRGKSPGQNIFSEDYSMATGNPSGPSGTQRRTSRNGPSASHIASFSEDAAPPIVKDFQPQPGVDEVNARRSRDYAQYGGNQGTEDGGSASIPKTRRRMSDYVRGFPRDLFSKPRGWVGRRRASSTGYGTDHYSDYGRPETRAGSEGGDDMRDKVDADAGGRMDAKVGEGADEEDSRTLSFVMGEQDRITVARPDPDPTAKLSSKARGKLPVTDFSANTNGRISRQSSLSGESFWSAYEDAEYQRPDKTDKEEEEDEPMPLFSKNLKNVDGERKPGGGGSRKRSANDGRTDLSGRSFSERRRIRLDNDGYNDDESEISGDARSVRSTHGRHTRSERWSSFWDRGSRRPPSGPDRSRTPHARKPSYHNRLTRRMSTLLKRDKSDKQSKHDEEDHASYASSESASVGLIEYEDAEGRRLLLVRERNGKMTHRELSQAELQSRLASGRYALVSDEEGALSLKELQNRRARLTDGEEVGAGQIRPEEGVEVEEERRPGKYGEYSRSRRGGDGGSSRRSSIDDRASQHGRPSRSRRSDWMNNTTQRLSKALHIGRGNSISHLTDEEDPQTEVVFVRGLDDNYQPYLYEDTRTLDGEVLDRRTLTREEWNRKMRADGKDVLTMEELERWQDSVWREDEDARLASSGRVDGADAQGGNVNDERRDSVTMDDDPSLAHSDINSKTTRTKRFGFSLPNLRRKSSQRDTGAHQERSSRWRRSSKVDQDTVDVQGDAVDPKTVITADKGADAWLSKYRRGAINTAGDNSRTQSPRPDDRYPGQKPYVPYDPSRANKPLGSRPNERLQDDASYYESPPDSGDRYTGQGYYAPQQATYPTTGESFYGGTEGGRLSFVTQSTMPDLTLPPMPPPNPYLPPDHVQNTTQTAEPYPPPERPQTARTRPRRRFSGHPEKTTAEETYQQTMNGLGRRTPNATGETVAEMLWRRHDDEQARQAFGMTSTTLSGDPVADDGPETAAPETVKSRLRRNREKLSKWYHSHADTPPEVKTETKGDGGWSYGDEEWFERYVSRVLAKSDSHHQAQLADDRKTITWGMRDPLEEWRKAAGEVAAEEAAAERSRRDSAVDLGDDVTVIGVGGDGATTTVTDGSVRPGATVMTDGSATSASGTAPTDTAATAGGDAATAPGVPLAGVGGSTGATVTTPPTDGFATFLVPPVSNPYTTTSTAMPIPQPWATNSYTGTSTAPGFDSAYSSPTAEFGPSPFGAQPSLLPYTSHQSHQPYPSQEPWSQHPQNNPYQYSQEQSTPSFTGPYSAAPYQTHPSSGASYSSHQDYPDLSPYALLADIRSANDNFRSANLGTITAEQTDLSRVSLAADHYAKTGDMSALKEVSDVLGPATSSVQRKFAAMNPTPDTWTSDRMREGLHALYRANATAAETWQRHMSSVSHPNVLRKTRPDGVISAFDLGSSVNSMPGTWSTLGSAPVDSGYGSLPTNGSLGMGFGPQQIGTGNQYQQSSGGPFGW